MSLPSFFYRGTTAVVGQDLLIIGDSRSHLVRRTTLGRTPQDEWSARRRVLYLTTHNTHKSQTFMPPAGFEPAIPASERPQTYAFDRAVLGSTSDYLHWLGILTVVPTSEFLCGTYTIFPSLQFLIYNSILLPFTCCWLFHVRLYIFSSCNQ